MKKLSIPLLFLFLIGCSAPRSSEDTALNLKCTVTVAPEFQKEFQSGNRLILCLTNKKDREPRNSSDAVLAVTPKEWNGTAPFSLTMATSGVYYSAPFTDNFKEGDSLYCQLLCKQVLDDPHNGAPGNLYSDPVAIKYGETKDISLVLSHRVPPFEIVNHPLVRTIEMDSKLLSEFFGRPRKLYASILLPAGFDSTKVYPVCYSVPGLNGKYTGINGMVGNADFINWWQSKESPKCVLVFLDSRGPYGDSYQMDSENNGPCGRAFTEELMPAVEKTVGYDPAAKKRYVMGCSTGGWVTLALQVFYPDLFDGCWAYSPDPVDFEHFGLTNIYEDESFFSNRFGYPNPTSRTKYGEITGMTDRRIWRENAVSRTGNYGGSGGQFGAYNAVFSPKGPDGEPMLMFDPMTGKINHEVAKQWEKYDLKKVMEKNWPELGPKLQGKIHVWMGDMDGLYSNIATRFLADYLEKTDNPRSEAKIEFGAMCGHCQNYDMRTIIEEIFQK